MAWSDYVTWFGEVQISDPACLSRATEGTSAQIDVFHSALVAGKTAGGPRGARAREAVAARSNGISSS